MASPAELLQPVLATLRLQLPPDRFALLVRHFDLLLRWNERLNLTSIREPQAAAVKHFGEALFFAIRLPRSAATLADVGSGAGFPGFPAAVARPDVRVTLVESNSRKAAFLKEVSRGVPNVEVHHGRFETLGRDFDWICLRGVAPDPLIPHLAAHARNIAVLTGPDGARKLSSCPLLSRMESFRPPWPTGRDLWMFHVEHKC